MTVMTCRWKDKEGSNKYNTFVPEVDRPSNAEDVDSQELQPGNRRKLQPRPPTEKGALFFKYSVFQVHEWVTHLRRVHSENPPLTVKGKVMRASNPFAPLMKEYYVHSKTAYYNSFFFEL